MKVSVIIPTCNRPQRLLRAIQSLQEQEWQDLEILVVDNAASPSIKRLIENLDQHNKIPVHYVAEPLLGLHNARHAGARVALSEILVFTDDDATFASGWIRAYVESFSEHPEMAAAGGPVRPQWECSPPEWLLEFIGDAGLFPLLSLMEQNEIFRMDRNGFFFGVNMAIRRRVLFEVGGFNPEAFGKTWLGDGETGLCSKLSEKGELIGYVPDALVYHHIPPERMTSEYFCHRMANEGSSLEYTYFHKKIYGTHQVLIRMVYILLHFGGTLGISVLKTFKRDRLGRLRIRMCLHHHFYRIRYVARLSHDKSLRELVLKDDWLRTL